LHYWGEASIKSRLEGLTFPCLLKGTEVTVPFISKQCNSDFTVMWVEWGSKVDHGVEAGVEAVESRV
jgi:hypothetical protein